LIAFPTTTGLLRINPNDQLLARAFSIEFPAMPDNIEFARRAEYVVHTNAALPDGVHAYKRTEPLKIPFNFRLHYNDHYCPQGALTLLQIAARLHAFVLPISFNEKGTEARVKSNIDYRNVDDAAVQEKAQAPFTVDIDTTQQNKIFSPLTARLELIFADNNEVGVSCNGYVEEVNVKLNGPYMRGPNNSFNLPTSADYSFVFVHRPGHGNGRDFIRGFTAQVDAYASDVRDRFYNTANMTAIANYQGFEPPTQSSTGGSFDTNIGAPGDGGTVFEDPLKSDRPLLNIQGTTFDSEGRAVPKYSTPVLPQSNFILPQRR